MLRLPEGMREKISELAKKNNRSMNAEIIARLMHTIIDEAHKAEFGKPYEPSLPAVNIILDSSGYPQSWDEIHEHLRAIRMTLKVDAIAMHTTVLSPPLESSSERQEEALKLHLYYEEKRK